MISGAATPAGETLTLRVGVGPAAWTDVNHVAQSLTCDPSNPCDLVVEIYGGPQDGSSPPIWVPFVVQLTYANSDPLATCGGPATGALSTGASDSLVDAWTKWTLDQCKQPGQKGAATRASFVGEGQAVQQFDSGLLDLAYTAAGADPSVGLDPAGASSPRAAVAVPVGIGAVTVGVGNGYGSGGRKVPFPTLSLTAGEVATVVGSGQYTSLEQQAPIVARNPDLAAPFFAPSSDMQVGVPSGTSASTWYLSDYLNQTAPGTWRVPDVGAAGPDVNKPRGVFADFGTASPDFNLLTTYTGRPSLEKVLFGIVSNTFLLGGVFVVSDLTTAEAETLSPVAIQTAPSGPFVAPTPASMDAAVAGMKPNAQGLLQPDLTPSDPTAYPLTYVEYALVPAQPLVDATCAPRPDAQAELTTWLRYVTGTGQKALPDGLEPLTPALATQAATAITKVGTTPDTCTPPAPPPTAPAAPPSGGSSGSSGSSGSGSSGNLSTGSGGAGSAPVVTSTSTPGAALSQPKTIAAKVPIPPYGGSHTADAITTVLALLGIAVLVTLAARFTAGHPASSDEDGSPP
jgi:hypothetical protein